ncbi:MAG: response regulator [Lachnospiraceae bacterium]|nr:response regulator [Lachnospiraceae bacterium]
MADEKILIVDDVETNRFTLRDIIIGLGYTPILTEHGEQALKVVERVPISLIISDVAMPVMDGYEFCTRIKENPSTRHIPVIFISAYDDPKDIVKGFEVNGEDYITKPFIPEVVKARVQLHLKVAESNRKLQDMNRKLHTSVEEQMKQNETERQNVLYALLRVLQETPCYDKEEMERLSYNCHMLAAALQLSGNYGDRVSDLFIQSLEIAAPLCDLGNVGIPTDIVIKFPALHEEEAEIYRNHPIIGADILGDLNKNSSYNDFLKMSISLARSHHENWDGSGYPDGLKGEEIPLEAQIVAIVRRFGRVVKRLPDGSMDLEAAWEQMDPLIGIAYNPEIYEILKMIAKQLR